MSKKAKAHRKKVAARNQRNANKGINVGKVIDSGMATPHEAHHIGKAIAAKGQNPTKIFNRRTQ